MILETLLDSLTDIAPESFAWSGGMWNHADMISAESAYGRVHIFGDRCGPKAVIIS